MTGAGTLARRCARRHRLIDSGMMFALVIRAAGPKSGSLTYDPAPDAWESPAGRVESVIPVLLGF